MNEFDNEISAAADAIQHGVREDISPAQDAHDRTTLANMAADIPALAILASATGAPAASAA